MSSGAPIPARFYPAGGDAHGHVAGLRFANGQLTVAPVDSPSMQVAARLLRVEARGFNHSQWAISWPAEGGEHLLIVDDAHAAPLRAAAPALFASGERTRRRGTRRFGLGLLLLVLLPLLFVAGLFLAVEPLAERVVEHIPPSVERQIGEAVLVRTRLESRMIEKGPASDALQAIGRRLARPGETLEFHLVERPEVNAFAAPGGIVVVFTGLMARAGSPEEVAGVLAHEIAHVELRHSLRQIVKTAGLRVIVAALAGDYSALGGWAAQLGELKFSRDAERDADARGLQRLTEARIDPAGMVRFFETLSASEGAKGPQPATMLSTHPATGERLARVKKAIAAQPAQAVQPIELDWVAVKKALGPGA